MRQSSQVSCTSKGLPDQATHPVQVCIGAVAMPLIGLRHIIVDDNVDALDVNAAANQVSGHQDALLTLLERLVYCKAARGSLVSKMSGQHSTQAG